MSEINDQQKYKIAFLLDVIKRYDHYIGTSNFKIGLSLSFLVTVILGLLIRFLLIEPATTNCVVYKFTTIFIILTCLASLISIFMLLKAVSPNTSSSNDYKSLIFFGDVSSFENGEEYLQKIVGASTNDILKDLTSQTNSVAKIVTEKFRILKIAINIAMFAVLPLLFICILLLILLGK